MVSQKWAYMRIMAGTVLGGVLGFYVMYRLENNYKEKMKERLKKYEMEINRRAQLEQPQQPQQQQDNTELLPES